MKPNKTLIELESAHRIKTECRRIVRRIKRMQSGRRLDPEFEHRMKEILEKSSVHLNLA